MNAKMQYSISASDLEIVLALSRSSTLANAGERLGMDASTVFRGVQRIERGLGQRLFERSRNGYLPNELALTLTSHAERMEVELESARSAAQLADHNISGSVRITTTDTVLHGLIAPALTSFKRLHPLVQFDLHTGNELANLTRREADIALRATKRPPAYLIGKHLGVIRVAPFMTKSGRACSLEDHLHKNTPWVAPDEALPEHPSVLWRKKHVPKAQVLYRVNSILSVAEFVAQGLGIGIIPLFLALGRNDLRQIGHPIEESETALWILTHTESRHLRRVSAVFTHFVQHIQLD